MSFWERMFRAPDRLESTQLCVNYNAAPLLPRGAAKIIRHNPLANTPLTILPGDLELREMPRGITYEEYIRLNGGERLCDTQVLDALVELILKKRFDAQKTVGKFFGDFSGQIFFLGTSFISEDGRGECVPFLNINTHLAALRYICPAVHPINHDVRCCACVFKGVQT